eukprot:6492558-Amphidinium_carterae.3
MGRDVALPQAGLVHEGTAIMDCTEVLSCLRTQRATQWTAEAPSPSELEQFAIQPSLPVCPLPPLTALQVQDVVKGLEHKAPGLDHWCAKELQALPSSLLESLSELYKLVESSGTVPLLWRCHKIVFLPKPGKEASPFGLRPIALLALLYRVYAKCRAIGQLLHHRGKSEVQDLPLVGLHSDLTRAYEQIPHSHLAWALRQHGFPEALLQIVLTTYAAHKFAVYASCAAEPCSAGHFGHTSGLPTLYHRYFVDDMVYYVQQLVGESMNCAIAHLLDALAMVSAWLRLHNLQMNNKTAVWTTHTEQEQLFQGVEALQSFQFAASVRDLGIDFLTHEGEEKLTQHARLAESHTRLTRLARANWSLWEKQSALVTIIYSKAFWDGCLEVPKTRDAFREKPGAGTCNPRVPAGSPPTPPSDTPCHWAFRESLPNRHAGTTGSITGGSSHHEVVSPYATGLASLVVSALQGPLRTRMAL